MILDRRRVLWQLTGVAAAADRRDSERAARQGRLTVRPRNGARVPEPGAQALGLHPDRDALLYIPKRGPHDAALPLIVSLHGAGGHQKHGIGLLQSLADAHGLVLLSPASRKSTWDVIEGGLGPDVEFLNQALEVVFDRCHIDASRLAIGGFSDGASYALTLGLANGDLFTHILAFSPGFTAHRSTKGKPRIFISHGTRDKVLPVEQCGRRIAERLKRARYDVAYQEFDGGHAVPPAMRDAAVRLLLGA